MTGGRPLRFLALTLGGWTAIRVAMLWPSDPITAVLAGRALAAERESATPSPIATAVRHASIVPVRSPVAVDIEALTPRVGTAAPEDTATAAVSQQPDDPVPVVPSTLVGRLAPAQSPFLPRPTPLAPGARRLAGSAWAILRGDGDGAPTGGRLGGAQAGVRLTYALGAAQRVAIAARVSTPLAGRGREAALGIDWKPTRLPVHVIAEQRVPIGRGRAGPALSVVGGLDPVLITGGLRLEGYGQAGAVARAGAFADGAVRLARPVAALGPARVDIGVGSWGGVQRGAARLDVGPGAALILPLANRNLRLTLDYRARVAGGAAPGSGLVLAIGSDF